MVEETGGCLKLCNDALKASLHPSRFGGSELGGDDEGGQALQRLADALQAPLAVGGSSRGRGAGLRLSSEEAEGGGEKRTPFAGVGHAVGGQERESLAERQAMALDAAEQSVLLAAGESAERVGERGADLSPSDCGLGVR